MSFLIQRKTEHLLSVIKFKCSSGNLNFGKFGSSTMSLTASQSLKSFIMKLVAVTVISTF